MKGKGVADGRGQERLPRQAARRPRGGDRRARRRAQHHGRRREAGDRRAEARVPGRARSSCPRTSWASEVATRKAYGEALAALGNARGDVVALDGEVSNSTYAEDFRDAHPRPLLRDVHRRAADGRDRGRHAGARLAAVRVDVRRVPLARVRLRPHVGDQPRELLPLRLARRRLDRRGRPVADGARGHRRAARGPRLDRAAPVRREPDREARGAMADREGISYLRTLRPATPVALRRRTRSSRSAARASLREGDDVAIVGAGSPCTRRSRRPTRSPQEGIEARVIDLYSIKPLDAETLPLRPTCRDRHGRGPLARGRARRGRARRRSPTSTSGRRVVRLAVHEMPHSGKPAELLAEAGIDAAGIAAAARSLAGLTPARRRAGRTAAVAPRARCGKPRRVLGPRFDYSAIGASATLVTQTLERQDRRAAERRLRHA